MNVIPADAKPLPRKPRWYQFSLRTMLLLVLVCATFCGWLKYRLDKAELQRAAVERIESAGGVVCYDFEIKAYGSLPPTYARGQTPPPYPNWILKSVGKDFFAQVLEAEGVNDRSACALDALSEIKVLFILELSPHGGSSDRRVMTDKGLAHICQLRELRVLLLSNFSITNKGFEQLHQLKSLEQLFIKRSFLDDPAEGTSDARFAKLGELLPNCKILDWE